MTDSQIKEIAIALQAARVLLEIGNLNGAGDLLAFIAYRIPEDKFPSDAELSAYILAHRNCFNVHTENS